MAINVFEGARRLALLAAIVGATVALVSIANNTPYLGAKYAIAQPDGPISRTEDSCPSDGRTVFVYPQTPRGRTVSVALCVLPMAFGRDSTPLIPYRVDEAGMIWGARPYSSEVNAYERALEKRFVLQSDHAVELDREATRLRRSEALSGLGWLVVGLMAFWVVVWTTGWIVRGFLGIPRGKDRADPAPGP